MEYVAKVIVVGDSRVGKTSLISRFVENKFSLQPEVTVGIESSIVSVETNRENKIKIQLWDTAGQERYRSLTFHYFRGTMAVLLVFDLTETSSFENLERWLRMIRAHALKEAIIFLIGNKYDLEKRVITKEKAEAFAKEHHISYFETSCKETKNVKTVFHELAIRIQGTFYNKKSQREPSGLDNFDGTSTENINLDVFEKKSRELSKKEKCQC